MIDGRGLAITGLSIGYLVFITSLLFLSFQIASIVTAVREQGQRVAEGEHLPGKSSAALHLSRAESLIGRGGPEIGFGNNEEARVMANVFAAQMKQMRDEFFTKRRQAPSKDQFVTYCALSDGQCAFLVYVPEYRKFKQDAKDDLAKIAWITAQKIASKKRQPGDSLAVAMKGQFVFGAIRIGEVASEESQIDNFFEGDKDDLLEFFVVPNEPATAEKMLDEIDLGPDAKPSDPFALPAESSP